MTQTPRCSSRGIANQHGMEGAVLLAVDQRLAKLWSLDRWCAMRRGLAVRPMARGDAETGEPMNVEAS